MKNDKILVVSATRSSTTKNTLLSKSLQAMSHNNNIVDKQYDVKFHTNNTQPLPIVYNQYINDKTLKRYKIVLFVHDDVYIDDLGCFDKINTNIHTYKNDIIGLAGATSVKIQKPTLWHLMSERKDQSGAVAHFDSTGTLLSTTCFGQYPKRCLILDGLFLAVNIESAVKSGWKFNESFQFHHYDIASCLDANSLHMKMSTCNIHVVHASPGLSDYNDKTFQQSQDIFLQRYGLST